MLYFSYLPGVYFRFKCQNQLVLCYWTSFSCRLSRPLHHREYCYWRKERGWSFVVIWLYWNLVDCLRGKESYWLFEELRVRTFRHQSYLPPQQPFLILCRLNLSWCQSDSRVFFGLSDFHRPHQNQLYARIFLKEFGTEVIKVEILLSAMFESCQSSVYFPIKKINNPPARVGVVVSSRELLGTVSWSIKLTREILLCYLWWTTIDWAKIGFHHTSW